MSPYNFLQIVQIKSEGLRLGIYQIFKSLHALMKGIAQLAMHSSYETCGIKDTVYMIAALKEFILQI